MLSNSTCCCRETVGPWAQQQQQQHSSWPARVDPRKTCPCKHRTCLGNPQDTHLAHGRWTWRVAQPNTVLQRQRKQTGLSGIGLPDAARLDSAASKTRSCTATSVRGVWAKRSSQRGAKQNARGHIGADGSSGQLDGPAALLAAPEDAPGHGEADWSSAQPTCASRQEQQKQRQKGACSCLLLLPAPDATNSPLSCLPGPRYQLIGHQLAAQSSLLLEPLGSSAKLFKDCSKAS